MNIFRIHTAVNGRETALLSIVDPSAELGFPFNEKCILGRLKDLNNPVEPENIEVNPKFLDHFHKTIVFFSQFSDQPIQLSEAGKHGFIYITDQRNGSHGDPLPADIIGSFETRDGAVVSESYAPNPAYQPISKHGVFVLQKELEALLIATAY